MTASHSLLHIHQGSVAELGASRVGVIEVGPSDDHQPGPCARLAVAPAHATQVHRNDFETQLSVRPGDVVPIGSQLHRIADLSEDGRGSVAIDPTPVALPGISLHPGSLVVQAGDSGELHARELAVDRIERRADGSPVAHLAVWPNDYERDYAEHHKALTRHTVAPGDEVELGEKAHRVLSRVLSIVPPDPARHLRGWVELATDRRGHGG